MSAIADAFGLPKEGSKHLRRTPWLVLAIIAFTAADTLGTASGVQSQGWLAWLDQLRLEMVSLPAIARLALSSNGLTLGTAMNSVPWELVALVLLARIVIITPVKYLLGQDIAGLAQEQKAPGPLVQWLRLGRVRSWIKGATSWVTRKLQAASPRWLLIVLFLSRVFLRVPSPFSWGLGFLDPLPYAGAAGIRLRWVILVEMVGGLTFLALVYAFGPDVVGAIKALV